MKLAQIAHRYDGDFDRQQLNQKKRKSAHNSLYGLIRIGEELFFVDNI